MLKIITSWFISHITEFGSIASVVGLGVTVWVALSLKSLSKKAQFKGRLPDYIRDLRKASSELTGLLNSDELDVDSAETILRTALSSVSSLKPKAPPELRGVVKSLEKNIKKVTKRRENINRASIRTIYNEASSLEADLKNYKKDENWRIKQ